MKIVLLRHGEPAMDLLDKLKMKFPAYDLKPLIQAYNESGLNTQKLPPSKAIGAAKDCNAFVCSDLPRSIESAKALNVHRMVISDTLFRESDLPYARWRYPKLTVFTWFILFRALWFLGYANNGEPIAVVRQRAQTATAKLKQLAEEQGSVMLIGHGIFNRLVAKELRSNGWQGPKNPGNTYWGFGIFRPTTR